VIPETKCGLSDSTQKKLIQIFEKTPNIDVVILYGSRAKGTYKPGSDIDLTIRSEHMSLSELLKLENEFDDLLLPYKIDVSLFNEIDNPALIDHINRVGVPFYKR
jgi:predicted nucleotidyltransferase